MAATRKKATPKEAKTKNYVTIRCDCGTVKIVTGEEAARLGIGSGLFDDKYWECPVCESLQSEDDLYED